MYHLRNSKVNFCLLLEEREQTASPLLLFTKTTKLKLLLSQAIEDLPRLR